MMKDGHKLSDMAVFYRVNSQSRVLEEVLMREGMPYTIVGGLRYYERKEVKDLLSYLKAINNPRDHIAFRRMVGTPSKGVGAKTLDKLQDIAVENGQGMMETFLRNDFGEIWTGRITAKLKALRELCKKLSTLERNNVKDIVEQILELSGLAEHYKDDEDPKSEERISNLEAFLNRAAEFDGQYPDRDLAAFLEEVALVADVDEWQEGEKLTLMTIHSAKGLEFDSVFVVGLEDGLLPHKNTEGETEAVEEERRLLYVAMTRAQRKLYLTNATQRFQWGKVDISVPSKFIDELPQEDIDEYACGDSMGIIAPGLMPKMGGGNYNSGGGVPQGKRRWMGRGQPRRKQFDDDEFFDDLDFGFEAEDEVQLHPDDEFYF
jgi:DNA helicase-2/ATP-dependent DNA helicase PcrA